jgi:4,4'-diapophytoene synthase
MPFRSRRAMAELIPVSSFDRDEVARKQYLSDKDFQSDLLERVSRTFALTIPQLPPALCSVVSNAYLLCRIVDTIEDEPTISGAKKQYFCRRFVEVLDGTVNAELFARELGGVLSNRTPAAEHDLIRRLPRVVHISRNFSSSQRQAVQRCVGTMAHGMAQFQLNKKQPGLETLQDIDRYCYYVAGVVGEMLTALFCLYSPAIAQQREHLIGLAVSFGQGLQMTNILKDVWEDYQNGACWLPRQIFVEEHFELRRLAQRENSPQFQRGIQRLIGVAHGHLKNALHYTLLIPRQEVGIRNFCLWAIGLAVLTLRKINRHLNYTEGNQVKISRASVWGTVLVSRLAVRHDRLLTLLFDAAGSGVPRTPVSTACAPAQGGSGALDKAV